MTATVAFRNLYIFLLFANVACLIFGGFTGIEQVTEIAPWTIIELEEEKNLIETQTKSEADEANFFALGGAWSMIWNSLVTIFHIGTGSFVSGMMAGFGLPVALEYGIRIITGLMFILFIVAVAVGRNA